MIGGLWLLWGYCNCNVSVWSERFIFEGILGGVVEKWGVGVEYLRWGSSSSSSYGYEEFF